jgi:hypothetical protein
MSICGGRTGDRGAAWRATEATGMQRVVQFTSVEMQGRDVHSQKATKPTKKGRIRVWVF